MVWGCGTPNPGSGVVSGFDRTGTLWAPYLEWEVENPSYSGNPFDLVATVTFTHSASGATHTTEMFYDGGDTWKWRFTGTEIGTWTFESASADAELDGLSGTVTINPNPDTEAYGFVTEYESATHTKWARQKGNDGEIETFVPQFVMYEAPDYIYRHREAIDEDIRVFLQEHGFTGFHVPVLCHWFELGTERCRSIDAEDPDPDPRTFEALELLITKTHAAGGVVHLWMWGDESRTQTPARWGLNGQADRRLQRYIAARLGPLPGWTMGYGFDLWEWVDGATLDAWHDYLHAHFGWPHLLGARSHKNRLTQLSEKLDYASYEQHRPDYPLYLETIRARPDKPAFSEDRFRIRDGAPFREKDYSMEDTRRGLWHSTLAGGVANIWGNLAGIPDQGLWYRVRRLFGRRTGSRPYPRPDWIRTYATFWKERFLPDMEPCPELAEYCLGDPREGMYVVYVEEAGEVVLGLHAMPDTTAFRVVYVDTRQPYEEQGFCRMVTGRVAGVSFPHVSDWAVALEHSGQDDPLCERFMGK
ncbi:DUF5060 domain-containing protein [Rhodocaloribacter litoris]|uniref:DUF5060 domain-containing protein n=1 Tax=Rhodocaloribacter litoris TaxID=2558931 RepID=UPI00141E0B97|nr:DUF5060 domain-containing protein [Rhodocaloribacter litoris]QXD16198.1 DUF5060 domain-containing protein [Rhodocaloribacter litoris]